MEAFGNGAVHAATTLQRVSNIARIIMGQHNMLMLTGSKIGNLSETHQQKLMDTLMYLDSG